MSGVKEVERDRHGGCSSFVDEEERDRHGSRSSFVEENTFTTMVDDHAQRE